MIESDKRYPSYNMFGFKVTPMTAEEQLALFEDRVTAREQCVVTYLNVHGLHVLQKEPAMVALHRESKTHVVIDGMPLIGLCRLANINVSGRHRVTNLDLIWPLFSLAAKCGWKIFFVGNSPEVLEQGLKTIRAREPNISIQGHHGFVGMDCPEVISAITNFGSNIVIVGMGTGLQERWIYENMSKMPASTSILAVGALLEYIAGQVKTPPRWMGRTGLEWLFRLAENPKRFWHRYLIEPWAVLWDLGIRRSRKRPGIVV